MNEEMTREAETRTDDEILEIFAALPDAADRLPLIRATQRMDALNREHFRNAKNATWRTFDDAANNLYAESMEEGFIRGFRAAAALSDDTSEKVDDEKQLLLARTRIIADRADLSDLNVVCDYLTLLAEGAGK